MDKIETLDIIEKLAIVKKGGGVEMGGAKVYTLSVRRLQEVRKMGRPRVKPYVPEVDTRDYVIVLDSEKFNRWVGAMNKNDRKFTIAEVARRIHRNKAMLYQALKHEKYDYKIENVTMANLMHYFGFSFDAIFKIVPVEQWEPNRHKQFCDLNRYGIHNVTRNKYEVEKT